jgi:MoxR-like ATPase
MLFASDHLPLATAAPDLQRQARACAQTFPFTKRGETLMRQARSARLAAQANVQALHAAATRGGATTDAILRALLPHANTPVNRASGAWIAFRSPLTTDVRMRQPARAAPDWDAFARQLWAFVRGVVAQPATLPVACEKFAASANGKGFQAGMLSPILHALAPRDFALATHTTLRLLARYAPNTYTGALRDYPAVNRAALALAAQVADALPPGALAAFGATDWLYLLADWVARDSAHHRQTGARAWRINQPDDAAWREWVAEGSVALPRAVAPDLLRDGDVVVAHHGGQLLRGYGRVSGPAFSAPLHPDHWRWPVVWADTSPTPITQPGWRGPHAALSAKALAALPLSRQGDVRPEQPATVSAASVAAPRAPYSIAPSTGDAPYTIADCAAETRYSIAQLQAWVAAIHRKGQAIIAGPPGAGKTYLAERLARLIGNPAVNRTLQLHPGYSYEDFMQGLRPQTTPDGVVRYALAQGHFLTFCEQARVTPGAAVLTLDEINRAHLTLVLGEALYLLEYRDRSLDLAAGGRLSIPANVRIIGTMNTADRTALPLDHALRRRFAWISLAPDYTMLTNFLIDIGYTDTLPLIALLKRVNRAIGDPDLALGVSYFLRAGLAVELPDIWRYEVAPYLAEVWYDRPAQREEFRWDAVRRALAPKPAKRSH